MIVAVLANSAGAAAGVVAGDRTVVAGDRIVVAGDRIVAVNGRPAAATARADFYAMVTGAPGTRLRLALRRGTKLHAAALVRRAGTEGHALAR